MARKKSTDTTEVKALRKLLLSLGLSAVTANRLIKQMAGHHADLSAKACDIQLYIAGHPEVKRPADYAARTLLNYADEQEARRTAPPVQPATEPVEYPAVPQQAPATSAPVTMAMWGDDD